MSEKQKEALAENLNERCKNLQFDEGLTKAIAVLAPKDTGAPHLDRFQADSMSDYDEEIDGLPVDDDTGKDQVRILPDSLREKQPPATRSTQHRDGSRKKEKSGTSHFFAAQIDWKKRSTMWTETQH